MPKRNSSILLNTNSVNIISDFCKRNDISEAAFSRKFKKNNRWISDLRRSKNLSLTDAEEAARMCILLNTTPEEMLLHEGKNEKETAKCQEDIKFVRELLEKEKSIKKAPADEGEGLDPKTQEILDFIDSASFEELDQVFRFVSYLKSQRGDKA